ncbi:MAG: AAA family ATPase [Chlamydiia bacterium]|nr:AAA family ATPase [Chlamydiia bacterium]
MLTENKTYEIEQNILGCMLKNYHLLQSACTKLTASHFPGKHEKTIFQSLKTLYEQKHKKIDEFSLKNFIGSNEISNEYIDNILAKAQILKFKTHIDHLIDSKCNRDLSHLLRDSMSLIGKTHVQDVIGMIIQKSFEINDDKFRNNIVSIKSALSADPHNLMEDIKRIQNDKNYASEKHISTGFCDLDKFIDGVTPSNLIILAARPSMGKTALALNLALQASKSCAVGFISLEMSIEQLCTRLLSNISDVPATSITKGRMTKNEFHAVMSAGHELKNLNIFFEESSLMTIESLQVSVRKMKHLHNIKFLIIDYLQLLAIHRRSSHDNRQQEISSISRFIKLLAKDLDICILCLSQLSRKVEERPDKKPKLSDLRESGSIEQDADQVLMLYRQEYYMQDNFSNANTISTPQLYISKNRHGETGMIRLTFKPSTMHFSSYEAEAIIDDSIF